MPLPLPLHLLLRLLPLPLFAPLDRTACRRHQRIFLAGSLPRGRPGWPSRRASTTTRPSTAAGPISLPLNLPPPGLNRSPLSTGGFAFADVSLSLCAEQFLGLKCWRHHRPGCTVCGSRISRLSLSRGAPTLSPARRLLLPIAAATLCSPAASCRLSLPRITGASTPPFGPESHWFLQQSPPPPPPPPPAGASSKTRWTAPRSS